MENVVKYTKQNFLYNRPFRDLETLNQEALGWLGRTANLMVHGSTKKNHMQNGILKSHSSLPCMNMLPPPVELRTYTVRKDNTISWKSNLYSLPLGTYKGRGSMVTMRLAEGHIIISDLQSQELCRHLVAAGKGLKIKNNDHARDKSSAINELIHELSLLLDNPLQVTEFLNAIRQAKPRYIRDQVLLFKQTIESAEKSLFKEHWIIAVITR